MRSGSYIRAAHQETANTLSRNNTYQCVSVLSIKQWHVTQVNNAYVWMNCIFQAQSQIEKWFKDLSRLFSIYNLSSFFFPLLSLDENSGSFREDPQGWKNFTKRHSLSSTSHDKRQKIPPKDIQVCVIWIVKLQQTHVSLFSIDRQHVL